MTYEQVNDPDMEQGEDRERYLCTDEELQEAGFTVADLADMPETDPEFIPDPRDRRSHLAGRHRAAGELLERFPAGRFGGLLELLEILGLDPATPTRCDPCSAL